MKRLMIVILCLLGLVLASCGQTEKEDSAKEETQQTEANKNTAEDSKGDDTMTYPQLTTEVAENEKLVEMKTSMGTIKIKLFPEQAPKTVENFITHSENGYYDGLKFHRVIKDFMVQGGDPNGNGTGGESIYGESFEDEFSPELFNLRGALSMANAGPDSNGSQFFIVQKDDIDPQFEEQMKSAGFPAEIIEAYMENGGTPWLDQKHTVFGQVVEGMDIVDEMANVEVGENDLPKEDIVIENIKVVK
ncbi:peptidylprolyl isomerase [Rossellomorea aquimaris]|jgi:peptidyl-prolyl cis-trans isomerase B (cyclophilin B)|uniref:Peptidyl-prolyl cis-trans isomerase n=1 Tax=Rossellomorea aquimaris TaxID=189382 RepID=A0A5D4TLR4_9BACI|nr:peptidylprolyl isomerase [Rossellomorea aquimaris]TYS75889.1 peptidylprolyl isomerase [Rossellomorea aquimaris]TYS81149.1 peptidylprolyl isomerase [Rossellomorea aquimaris]